MNIQLETLKQVAAECDTTVEHVAHGVQLVPVRDQIIIIRHEGSYNTSKGGIHLSPTEAPEKVIGTVVAVGPGNLNLYGSPNPISVGRFEKVRFRENFGESMTVDGHEYHVIKDCDVMCVVPHQFQPVPAETQTAYEG